MAALRTVGVALTTADTITTVCSGSVTGTQILGLTMLAKGSISTAGKLKVYYYDGTANYLIDELQMIESTSDDETAGWQAAWTDPYLVLVGTSTAIRVEMTIDNDCDIVARLRDL